MTNAGFAPFSLPSMLRKLIFLLVLTFSFCALSYGQCPTNDRTSWPDGSTVYFRIDPNMPPEQRDGAYRAIARWNQANQANNSGVRFVETVANSPNGDFGPPNLIIQNGQNPFRDPQTGDLLYAPAEVRKIENPDGTVATATITLDARPETGIDPNYSGYDTIFDKIFGHEIGHTMGLGEVSSSQQRGSIMNTGVGVNDSRNNIPLTPTQCDQNGINTHNNYAYSGGGGGGTLCEGGPAGSCLADLMADQCWNTPACGSSSPILIDVNGDGFALTDAADGVAFDLNNDSSAEVIAWTTEGADDGWLALDRNANGHIDNGGELFGNFTWQYWSNTPNGFNALAWFDQIERGGNGDGVIDSADAVFANLRLWQDSNHNGVSEADELRSLPSLAIETLHLDYKESKRVDAYGNQFRYRAKVDDARQQKTGRWAWDVFLVKQ